MDGIEFFEDWCGPVEAADTFTSRTISGGCHKVYKYTPELDGMLKSGQLTPLALCDILFNGRGFTFSEGYEIINRVMPREPPKSVINFIMNNVQNTLVNFGNISQNAQYNVQHNVIAGALGATEAASMSERINVAMGIEGVTWRVNNLDSTAYQLIPDSRECCVQTGHVHMSDSHSCMYVYKTALICNCFSHGKRVVQGFVSRAVRDLFFEISEGGKGVMVQMVHRIAAHARHHGMVRENGCVLQRVGSTHANVHVGMYREFVRTILRDDMALKERPRRFNDLMIYMHNIDSVDFPFVKRNKRYIGFANGLLDLSTASWWATAFWNTALSRATI